MPRQAKNKSCSCDGKKRYHSVGAARAALRGSILTFGDQTLVYYECRFCEGFHIGHPRPYVQRQLHYDRLLSLIDRAMNS